MFKPLLLLLLLCALAPLPLLAVAVPDLYQGQAPLTQDVTSSQRQALSDVLRKVSTRRDILTQPAAVKALEAPAKLLRASQYQTRAQGKWLHADFTPAAIHAVLQQSDLAVLGSNRPSTLVWLADDSALLSEQDGTWAAPLREAANCLGLPLLLPLMDLNDAMAVNATDVRGGFLEPLLLASRRYSAELIVLATAQGQAPTFTLAWSAYQPSAQGSATRIFTGQAQGDATAIAQRLTDQLAAWQVQAYGAKATGAAPSEQKVVIEGVADMSQMVAVQQLFRGLSNVSAVKIGALQGDRVDFTLSLQGDARELTRLLQVESRLVAQSGDNASVLYYRWQPR
ncbi:MAG: DUF2066 domain-containing protein [Aeromonas sp.]